MNITVKNCGDYTGLHTGEFGRVIWFDLEIVDVQLPTFPNEDASREEWDMYDAASEELLDVLNEADLSAVFVPFLEGYGYTGGELSFDWRDENEVWISFDSENK